MYKTRISSSYEFDTNLKACYVGLNCDIPGKLGVIIFFLRNIPPPSNPQSEKGYEIQKQRNKTDTSPSFTKKGQTTQRISVLILFFTPRYSNLPLSPQDPKDLLLISLPFSPFFIEYEIFGHWSHQDRQISQWPSDHHGNRESKKHRHIIALRQGGIYFIHVQAGECKFPGRFQEMKKFRIASLFGQYPAFVMSPENVFKILNRKYLCLHRNVQ